MAFYSSYGLTAENDRLPTLLGLAAEIQLRTNLEFQCGH